MASPLTPLTAGVYARQRELEEALSAHEAVADERGRMLSRAKSALEALHAELLRTRAEAAAYQAQVRPLALLFLRAQRAKLPR